MGHIKVFPGAVVSFYFKGHQTEPKEGGIWGTTSTADLGNIAPRSCDERVGSADVKPKKRSFGSPQRGRKKKEFS